MICSLLSASTLWARDYYVSPSGDDAADGASPERAFKTLEHVNGLSLKPGDAVKLQAGATFVGQLRFDRGDNGTAAEPVTLSSYFVGPLNPSAARARIVSANGNAIEVRDVSHFRIQDLEISGQATPESAKVDGNGIYLVSEAKDAAPGDILISGVTVSGFTGDTNEWERTGNGIYVDVIGDGSGFDGVTIQDALLFENDHSGLTTESHAEERHRNVNVQRVESHHNRGTDDSAQYSGSGIVISGVNGGSILDSKSYENGERNHRDGGPVGIWAWNADSIRISGCESHHNHTSGGSDGGGFDFDGGVTHSIIENNISHDNDGAGYMLCTYAGADPVTDNIVRNNSSVNDGQKNGYGALVILGDIRDSVYENNTVTVDAAQNLKAIWYWFWAGSNVSVRNNRFIIGGGANLLTMTWWDKNDELPVGVEGNEIFGQPGAPTPERAVRVEYGDPELKRSARNYHTYADWMNQAKQPSAFRQRQ